MDGTVRLSISDDVNPATGFVPVRIPWNRMSDVVRLDGKYSGTTFKEGYRNSANAEQGQEVILLDFDSGFSIAEAMATFEQFFGLIATTKSHMKVKHGVVSERFRVVLPTDQPVMLDAESFRLMMTEVMRSFPQADVACKNIDRFYYGFPGAEVFELPGRELFQWMPYHWQAEKRKRQERQRMMSRRMPERSGDDIEQLITEIERQGVDITANYSDWIRIAYALNREYGPTGEGYFHRISRFHPGYNPRECSRQYRRCASSQQVTKATLYYIAKQAGIIAAGRQGL